LPTATRSPLHNHRLLHSTRLFCRCPCGSSQAGGGGGKMVLTACPGPAAPGPATASKPRAPKRPSPREDGVATKKPNTKKSGSTKQGTSDPSPKHGAVGRHTASGSGRSLLQPPTHARSSLKLRPVTDHAQKTAKTAKPSRKTCVSGGTGKAALGESAAARSCEGGSGSTGWATYIEQLWMLVLINDRTVPACQPMLIIMLYECGPLFALLIPYAPMQHSENRPQPLVAGGGRGGRRFIGRGTATRWHEGWDDAPESRQPQSQRETCRYL